MDQPSLDAPAGMPGQPAVAVVAVGGVDPGGGAGLVQDDASARSLGARTVLIGTAWTTQSGEPGDCAFEPRPPASVRDALRWAVAGTRGAPIAVKVGMVATSGVVHAILEALTGFSGPVVFDPVLRASNGGSLFQGLPADLLPLVRRASVVTPNLAEAEAFTGAAVGSVEEALAAAHRLRAMGAKAVLVKGGHLVGDALDVLVDGTGHRFFRAPRLPGSSPRGTGCALATGLAVELVEGRELRDAVERAKLWLTRRIAAARTVSGERHLGP